MAQAPGQPRGVKASATPKLAEQKGETAELLAAQFGVSAGNIKKAIALDKERPELLAIRGRLSRPGFRWSAFPMVLGISEAVELTGRIASLVKQGATMELQERIIELREAVLNVKEELLELREENTELKRAAAQRQNSKFDGHLYWLETEGERQGPFCQKCYDKDGKTVRLIALPAGWNFDWNCTVCEGNYGSRR